ncbi:MAG: DUF3881 family protein [Lachnospiraceae bacterium]|nr:DUF3881 family protein [Lachnospiraceae bacterium]MDY5741848.1 DUF3881 family protein [Lachnospiraceae bacterium]
MHQYLRAIGYQSISDNRKVQDILQEIRQTPEEISVANVFGESARLMSLKGFCADDIGILYCGEYLGDLNFYPEFYVPFLDNHIVTTAEMVRLERHSGQASYMGVLEDNRVGITLIFFLTNAYDCISRMALNSDRIAGYGGIAFSGLSTDGCVLLPIRRDMQTAESEKKQQWKRNLLIQGARNGDEKAIEHLTREDIETYSMIAKRLEREDVYSIVNTYFMPAGYESEKYSLLGDIIAIEEVMNRYSEEKLWKLWLNCNDMELPILIHKDDLLGEPAVGRRFKGIVWLQGRVLFDSGQNM